MWLARTVIASVKFPTFRSNEAKPYSVKLSISNRRNLNDSNMTSDKAFKERHTSLSSLNNIH